jgi:hypothetical protein
MTVNRERQKVSRRRESLDLDYSTLEDAALEIASLIGRYGKDATIKQYSDYGEVERLGVFVLVDETDAEMTKRIAQEEKWAAEQKVRDLAELERLKKQYGG